MEVRLAPIIAIQDILIPVALALQVLVLPAVILLIMSKPSLLLAAAVLVMLLVIFVTGAMANAPP